MHDLLALEFMRQVQSRLEIEEIRLARRETVE